MFSSSAKRAAYPARGKGFHWQPLGPYTCSMGKAGGCAASSSCAVSWGHPTGTTYRLLLELFLLERGGVPKSSGVGCPNFHTDCLRFVRTVLTL